MAGDGWTRDCARIGIFIGKTKTRPNRPIPPPPQFPEFRIQSASDHRFLNRSIAFDSINPANYLNLGLGACGVAADTTSAIRKSDFLASISLLLVSKSDFLVSISLLLVSKSDFLASISLLLVSKSDFLVSISLLLVSKSDFLVSISLLLVSKSDFLVSVSLLLVSKSDFVVADELASFSDDPAQLYVGSVDGARVCVECFGVSRCRSQMRILAAIEDPVVPRKILDSLGLPSRAPPVAPARHNRQDELAQF